MTYHFKFFIPSLILTSFIFGGALFAQNKPDLKQDVLQKLINSQTASGQSQTTPGKLVGNLIHILLGILGIIFVVITVYAGYLYMTAGGNDDQIATAKKLIFNAIIGIIIILMSWAITDFILYNIYGATSDLRFNN